MTATCGYQEINLDKTVLLLWRIARVNPADDVSVQPKEKDMSRLGGR
jgi:hypothetical protein